MDNNNDDFLLELDAFNPKWQTVYRTVQEAAKAAGVLSMYNAWLKTSSGALYQAIVSGVPDTAALNESTRRAVEHARNLSPHAYSVLREDSTND